ncbi:ABC transporter permease [Dyella mobilis]|nr:FtsX-like permease family protein [Dyella mobilis]
MHPMLSSLRHHKLTVFLLILQVALTCAVVCNVVFLVVDRIQQIALPSGLDEPMLSIIESQSIDKKQNQLARHDADLAALRAIPGVKMAVAADSLPFGDQESSYGTCATLEQLEQAAKLRSMQTNGCVQPAAYAGTPGELNTLGIHLVAGRDFRDDEYVDDDKVPAAILSAELAQKLFPAGNALGNTIYTGERKPIRVVGIVQTLVRPRLYAFGTNQLTMLFPSKSADSYIFYVLRSAPADRQRVLKAAAAKLMQLDPDRILPPEQMQTFEDLRRAYFQRDRTMVGLLVASCAGLLFVTALGISGLANFWVQQRRRQIGVRRAIGATRSEILRHFLLENFVIVSAGILVGVVLAVVLNLLLMKQYEVPRLPWFYLPAGALVLWSLGQLAVLAPAMRASAVPPVVATRSA